MRILETSLNNADGQGKTSERDGANSVLQGVTYAMMRSAMPIQFSTGSNKDSYEDSACIVDIFRTPMIFLEQ